MVTKLWTRPEGVSRMVAMLAALTGLGLLASCPSSDPAGNDDDSTSNATSESGSTQTGDATESSGTAESTGTESGESSESSESESGDPGPCEVVMCGTKLYECGDCIDNDNDGTVDQGDIECIGPCDDDEDHFATGVPGDNADPCKQDCFWDGDSGAGNDGCDWNLKCDPNNPGGDDCPYDPNFKNCPDVVDQMCKDVCSNTPPGCDCFGCCTVEQDGMSYDIYLGDEDCSLEDIENTCQPCQKFEDCDNECEPELCEQCFGEELPPECDEPECPDGQDSCMVDQEGGDNCPEGQFCLFGCCNQFVPPP